MSFLDNSSENLSARLTNNGRKKIAQGSFNIKYFQIGDSEFDYGFDGLKQKVFTPFDKDSQVKYPYKISESTVSGTTYGTPIQLSTTETIKNNVGAAGYVSEYLTYNVDTGIGSTIECGYEEIDIEKLNGTNLLDVPSGSTFYETNFITIIFDTLGMNNTIKSDTGSLVFQIINLLTGSTGNTLTLDRVTPNFTSLSGKTVTVICNDCNPYYDGENSCLPISSTDQQDAWNLNTVWSRKPIGLDYPTDDESLTGYTSNVFMSTKEFLGYNTSSGQTTNTGTTISNSFGDLIIVSPEEQHSLSILHYSKPSNILLDPDSSFKYEDYIGNSTTDERNYFEVYIPFIYYHRNTGTTIGARFFMDSANNYINSSAIDTRSNQLLFKYLIDEQNIKVGKIFVNNKTIVFDDQEIVAALDYKSNRRYTLPIPRISLVPTDTKCNTNGDPLSPLMDGTTGQTIFVTYSFQYSGDTMLNGLPCNHYLKIVGENLSGDVSIKFGENNFSYLNTSFSGSTEGFIANKLQMLVQKVTTGTQPDPAYWRMIDFTSEIPNHTVGDLIDPSNLRNARFTITDDEYENQSVRYDLETYLGQFPNEPSTAPEFGDDQPFTGSVKLVRATDIEVMRFMVNLPSTDFTTTQNPSYISGKNKRITEVTLLDENKEVLVIAKTSSPIVRTGTQVFAVKLDI
jgi:hypothetical protein